MGSLKHLLVALDFNEVSEHALERALDLASILGARVTALHVYSAQVLRFTDVDYVPTPEEAAELSAASQRQLDEILARHRRLGIELESLVRGGRVGDEICAAAEELGADMIVVGTHGRGAIGRALLGSIALDVLRHATVPVLSVHERRRRARAA